MLRVVTLILLSSLVLAACGGTTPRSSTPLPTGSPSTAPSTAPGGEKATIAPEIGAWLRENAFPLTTTEPGSDPADLAPLKATIGEARIVALGEATHGTHEFFQMKHRLVEYLVKEMGFTVFAIEASWPEANLVNDYVQTGRGDPAALLGGLGFWTWDTQEVLDLIEWMRSYNESRGAARPVSFVGFDMQQPRRAIEQVTAYLDRVDPDAGARAAALLDCITPYRMAASDYALLPQNDRNRCRQDLQAVYDLLSQHQADYTARTSGDEFAVALHSARAVQQFEAVFSTGSASFEARDRAMAENVAWLLDRADPDSRMVLWAHNAHAGVDATEGRSMGSFLREQYGAALVTIGFSFYGGSFNAFGQTAGGEFSGLSVHQAVPPAENSCERTLHTAGLARFFLDLRAAEPGRPGTDWLFEPHLLRRIGAAYDDAHPEAHFQEAVLPEMFDVLIYFEDTSPSHLLSQPSGGSPASGSSAPAEPANLQFEDDTAHWALFGDRPDDYSIGTDRDAAHSGTAGGYLRSTVGIAPGYGALLQTFAARDYRGQRLRLSAYARTDRVAGGAGVLLRVDGPGGMLAIRNMQGRPITGTTGWTRYDLVLDIPPDGVAIVIGAWLAGSGQIALDDFQVEVVGVEVPVTP